MSKSIYDRQPQFGTYGPTHEIALNQAFEYISFSQYRNFVDIGGGTWTAASVAAHHISGQVKLIEINEEVFSCGKQINEALVSSLPTLRRIQAICGDYFDAGKDFLHGFDVVFHSANLTGERAKKISKKIINEMDVGTLFILTSLTAGNFFIDGGRLEEAYPPFFWVDEKGILGDFRNFVEFDFFKKTH